MHSLNCIVPPIKISTLAMEARQTEVQILSLNLAWHCRHRWNYRLVMCVLLLKISFKYNLTGFWYVRPAIPGQSKHPSVPVSYIKP